MKFSEFLKENSSKIMFSFWRDGRVSVWADGKKYVYGTDAIDHDRWEKLSKKDPQKVWDQIKNYVQKGWATQIEPN